jgi:hypothetical protein
MAPLAEFPTIAATSAPYPTYAGMSQIPPQGESGSIPGDALRPGAIDQSQFQQMLQAQYRAQQQGKGVQPVKGLTLADYRKLAGIPTAQQAPATQAPTQAAPQAAPQAKVAAPAAGDGIPTLSLEQFAALTGMPLPNAVPETVPNSAQSGVPLATGPVETVTESDPAVAAMSQTAAVPETADAADGTADGIPVLPSDGADMPAATAKPASDENSRVVMLDTYPDREEQRQIAAQGKTWRMKETPGARELFLGPDGEFGWDDFIDIINPLQHIPVVAQIYRAVTGDQAYGLSNFIGALPFGVVSVASAVADTVIRAQTGRDAGTDMAARVLGIDNRTPEEANLHLVTQPTDQAAAAPIAEDPNIQVAAVPAVEPWTRDSAGIGRD